MRYPTSSAPAPASALVPPGEQLLNACIGALCPLRQAMCFGAALIATRSVGPRTRSANSDCRSAYGSMDGPPRRGTVPPGGLIGAGPQPPRWVGIGDRAGDSTSGERLREGVPFIFVGNVSSGNLTLTPSNSLVCDG